MKVNIVSAQSLKIHLEKEARLYHKYLELLAEERNSVTKFAAEKVEGLTERREAIFQEIQGALVKRLEMVKTISGSEKNRLTDVIRAHFKGTEMKDLLARANHLKGVTEKLRSQSREFNQIVNFGLNVVNGTLSIYMSATQNVNKSYSKKGMIKESFNPQGTRHTGVIKEA